MKQTQNYKLNKPGYEEFGDVETLNENWEKVDEAMAASDPTKAGTKETPADADGVLLADSAAAGGLKRLTWSNVKAALGKVFVPLARKINGKTLEKDVTLTAGDVGAVPTGRKVNGKSLEKDVTLTAKDVGAAIADENCNYNFTNKGLNSVDIDTEFAFNYVTAISEAGHGTRPVDGWICVVNYYATHFLRQVATTCNPVVNVGTSVAARVFERYRWQGDTQWSDWVEVITKDNIGVTSVLTSAETTPSVNNQIAWQYG